MDRRLALVFVAALALCALLTKAHVVSWNDRARIATVDALTANHTFQLDGSPYAARLGDEIRFHGRTYAEKPPLLALLGAAVATLIAPFGITLRATPGTAIYLITLGTVGVWFAIGCSYAYAFQRMLGFGPRVAVAVAALSGAATLTLPYATVMNNHVACGAAALAGCYHLYRGRADGGRSALLAGLFFGLAYAFDTAGIVYALAAGGLLAGRPLREWALCAASAAPLVVLQSAFNVAISGSAIPPTFNAAVWSDPSLPLHTLQAAESLHVFSLADYGAFVVRLTVGAHGIVPFTPMIVLIVYGLVIMARTPGRSRAYALSAAATFGVFFALIVLLQNDAHSRNFGERRYVDLFFALCVGLGPALAALRGAAARAGALALVVLSAASAGLGTVAPFGGRDGEWGFVFAAREFSELSARAPFQAAIDVVMVVVLIAVLTRLTARAMNEVPERRAVDLAA